MTWQAAQPIREDIWWHLRLGSDFWEGRPLSDPGQFGPFSTDSWVPTQWLTQMLMSVANQFFALDGLSWLFGVALVSLVGTVYLSSRTFGGPLAAAVATGVAIIGMSASLSPRPHMVTYVFVAATLGAWLRALHNGTRPWWLIPLTWVWACAHGMWFIGPVIGMAVAIGAAFDQPKRLPPRSMAIPVLSALVALATPVGPKLVTAPFAVSDVSGLISEWQPPDFRSAGPAVTVFMLLLIIVNWSRGGRSVSWVEIGLFSLALGWTLLAARTVTVGAIIAAPLFANSLQMWMDRPVTNPRPREKLSVWASAAGWLATLAVVLAATNNRPVNLPSSIGAYLDELPAGSVVFVPDTLGGWIMWEYPQLRPVVDGLTESYSLDYWSEVLGAASAAPGWKVFIERAEVRVALIPSSFPLAEALTDQLSWIEVARDGEFVLLVTPELSAGVL